VDLDGFVRERNRSDRASDEEGDRYFYSVTVR